MSADVAKCWFCTRPAIDVIRITFGVGSINCPIGHSYPCCGNWKCLCNAQLVIDHALVEEWEAVTGISFNPTDDEVAS